MLLSGIIAPCGTTIVGEGFKCQKYGPGTYVVMFDRPLPGIGIPVATIYGGNGGEWETFDKSIAIIEFTDSYMVCITSDPVRHADCGFTFMVNVAD